MKYAWIKYLLAEPACFACMFVGIDQFFAIFTWLKDSHYVLVILSIFASAWWMHVATTLAKREYVRVLEKKLKEDR